MVKLAVADTGVTVDLHERETILAGLFRSGYAYRVGCRRGGCGICKVDLVDGAVDYPAAVATQALTEQDRTAGSCLSCRAVPTADTTIRLRADDRLRLVAPFLAALAGGVSRKAGTD